MGGRRSAVATSDLRDRVVEDGNGQLREIVAVLEWPRSNGALSFNLFLHGGPWNWVEMETEKKSRISKVEMVIGIVPDSEQYLSPPILPLKAVGSMIKND